MGAPAVAFPVSTLAGVLTLGVVAFVSLARAGVPDGAFWLVAPSSIALPVRGTGTARLVAAKTLVGAAVRSSGSHRA